MGRRNDENIKAVNSFASLIDNYSYCSYISKGRLAPLTNITFFLGAGFSKAWDTKYPGGDELFNIYDSDKTTFSSETHTFATELGYFPYGKLSPKIVKDLVYQLNMQLKYPTLRTRYMDERSISILINEVKALIQRNFTAKVGDCFWDESAGFQLPKKLSCAQQAILNFFRYIELQEDGSRGIPSGVRMNFITTNYDFLVETILNSTNGSIDETVFLYTYRGITPTHVCGIENPTIVHNHTLVRNLFKINGGFEIFCNANEYHFDYRKKDYDDIKKNPPCLILPSREQNYSDYYFSSVFTKAVRLLHESRILVIVGYSMPEEDFLLRFLLRHFAEDQRDIMGKIIFYVDMMNIAKQINKIDECFPHFTRAKLPYLNYSGRFEDFAEKAYEEFKWKEPIEAKRIRCLCSSQ